MLVESLPLVGVLWARQLVDGWGGGRAARYDDRRLFLALAAGAAAVVGFWVLRNLPFAAWLMP
jgi:hypothetical protein